MHTLNTIVNVEVGWYHCEISLGIWMWGRINSEINEPLQICHLGGWGDSEPLLKKGDEFL